MARTNTYLAYRLTVLATAAVSSVAGVSLLVAFLQSTILPAAASGGRVLSTNYWGCYLAATAGGLLLIWACVLTWSARQPVQGRSIGMASAAGLLLIGLVNLVARFSGEYGEAAEWQRLATTATTLLALALIWLAPAARGENEERG